MADQWLQTGHNFWNIRGSLKIAGLIDVGTQMSVVKRTSGGFVLLDSYLPDDATREQLWQLTDEGRAVEAIVNLHPFHTLHVLPVARLFPHAKLYGTERHLVRFPELSWEATSTQSAALGELYAQDLHFLIPRGVEFAPVAKNRHFASVLAFHPTSGTLHVDDTLTWFNVPLIGGLRFHPSLSKVLEARPGAVAEFRSWLSELRHIFPQVRTLCTAHMKALPPNDDLFTSRLEDAISKIEKVLAKHEQQYG